MPDFFDTELRVGEIIRAEIFAEAKKPAYKLWINFGEALGIKTSSAQITSLYTTQMLVGKFVIAVTNLEPKQVVGVCNFPEKNIAGVISQVLILGAIDKDGKVILVHPSQKSENGLPIA